MRTAATGRVPVLTQLDVRAGDLAGVPGILRVALFAGAAAYIALFIGTAILRLGYPFPLETTEPGSLAEVQRILSGQPIYVAPSLEYVPLVYGPVFFYASALVASVVGATFLPLRLVSLLASCGSVFLVFRLVQRETGSRGAGLVAGGLLAASNPLAQTVMDLGRVDALFTLLVLAAVYLARTATLRAQSRRWVPLCLSGGLMGLAAFTKLPIAAAPIVIGICIGLACCVRGQAIAFVASVCLSVGLVVLLLRLQTGPWITFYLLELPARHAIGRELISRFWFNDVLPRFGVALVLGPLFLLGSATRGDRRAVYFFAPVLLSIIGVAWVSRAGGGGAANVLLPGFATIAILLGLGLHEGLHQFEGFVSSTRVRAFQGYIVAICIVQLALAVYDPRAIVPYRTDRTADEELAAAIAPLSPPVFAPDFGGYTTAAQGPQPVLGAVDELRGGFGGGMTTEGERWQAALRRALEQRRFKYVLAKTNDFSLKGTLTDAGYIESGPLIRQEDNFYAWKDARTPEAQLFVAPAS